VFKRRHGAHFTITTFSEPSAVLRRIHNREYPDALLCDVFFYNSVEEAERVEGQVEQLARDLKQKALEIGANDHRHATGIVLMRRIYEHFGNRPPKFPMYAYTSKGPFLLEQTEWEDIATYGAQVLLKNRVTPAGERTEIEGDIELYRAKRSLLARLRYNYIPKLAWLVASSLFSIALSLCIGRLIRGTW
jgi:hypothetical protein